MKHFKLSLLTVGVLSAFMSAEISAAGLGRMHVYSGLGQPLDAEIQIIASPQEIQTMSAQLAPPSAFANAGVQFADALKNNQLYFQIVKKNNGKSFLKITSNQVFNEPFLDFLVELRWASGKLVREYTFLLNPIQTAVSPATIQNSNNSNNSNNFHENYQNSFGEAAESDNPEINAALNQARANLNAKYQKSQQQIINSKNQNQSQNTENTENTENENSANSFGENENANANSYLVKNGDTLRQISERIQQNNPNVTLEQMLFAIYQNNPNAFIGKDINKLKAGANLQIPSEEQVAQMISPQAARRSYRQQSAVWANYRKKLANQTNSIDTNNVKNNRAKSSQSVQGKITPEVVENQPQNITNQQDRLRISTTENASANPSLNSQNRKNKNNQLNQLQAQIDELKTRADAAELDRIAKEQALQESQSRVKELEKNVEDLNNLLAVKNQQLANLEQISSANTNANTNLQQQNPQVAPPQQPKSSEMAPVEKPKKPKSNNGEEIFDKGDEKENPNEKAGFINKNLGTIGGSLMILSLLGAGIMFLRKKKRKLEEQHNEQENTVTGNNISEKNNENLVENIPEPNSASEQDNESENTDENTEFLDPLQEAQNYIDANQYDKAEEILLNAFNQDTTNTAFMAKLLEIYAHQNNTERFENIARQLQNIVGNDSEDWIQTKALGHQIDPTNPLYLDDEIAEDNPADELLNSLDDTDGFTETESGSDDLGILAEPESEVEQETAPEPEPELESENDLLDVATEVEQEPTPELEATELLEESADEDSTENDLLDEDEDEEPVVRKPVEEAHLESSIDAAELPQGNVRTDMALDFDSLDSAEENSEDIAENKEPSLEDMAAQHLENDLENEDSNEELLDSLENFNMEESVEDTTQTEIPAENEELENIHENPENIFDTEPTDAEVEPEAELETAINEALDNVEDTQTTENTAETEITEEDVNETNEIAEDEPVPEITETVEDLETTEENTEAEPAELTESIEENQNQDVQEISEEETNDLEDFEDSPLNETETKFELAKAYEEMGDLEGAMDLWSELMVSQEASPEIIQQAKEHLDRLSAEHPQDGGEDDLSKLL